MIWPLTEPSDLKQRGASIRSQRCFLPPRGRRFEPVSKQPNQLDILLIRCLTSPDGMGEEFGISVGPLSQKTSLIWRERITCVRTLTWSLEAWLSTDPWLTDLGLIILTLVDQLLAERAPFSQGLSGPQSSSKSRPRPSSWSRRTPQRSQNVHWPCGRRQCARWCSLESCFEFRAQRKNV